MIDLGFRWARVILPGFSLAGTLHAQVTSEVRGFAYDSLRSAPLAGAFISLAGSSRSAVSDSLGRFRFDSLTAGTYTLVMHHEVLDSVGFSGRRARVVLSGAAAEVTIAVPSFGTLWRAACGGAPPGADTGFVYGVVRSTDERPVRRVKVAVAWNDLTYTKVTGFNEKSWGASVPADSLGNFALCGVPTTGVLHVLAGNDSLVSDRVEMGPIASRVARRDLLVGPRSAADSTSRGVVTGIISSGDGAVQGALIVADDVHEARSDETGRFWLRDVPSGTRQIEIRAIGAEPVSRAVDVRPGDTAIVSVQLKKAATLPEVNVTAPATRFMYRREIMERRQSGLGYFRDSTAIERLPLMAHVFDGIAGINVRRGGGSRFVITGKDDCRLAFFIDRVKMIDAFDLNLLAPDQIATLEVYNSLTLTPAEYQVRNTCGAIVVWTKRFFK